MAYELDVWLYGTHVAALRERRTSKIDLVYTEDALRRWGVDGRMLSLSMPLPPDGHVPQAPVRTWLEGLLPEGDARSSVEEAFGVRRGDLFGLLEATGRDCAGAVVLQPAGDAPPPEPGPPATEPITDEEIRHALDRLPERALAAEGEVRVSLPGQQAKLVLAQTADGGWGRPIRGTPSTHIVKPQDERYPGMAAIEVACVNTAAALGLGECEAAVVNFAGRTAIVVRRYDRHRDPVTGFVERVHQEDLCQALAIDPNAKYWTDAGRPERLGDAARLLDAAAVDGHTELLRLARVMAFHIAIGNADAHAKNHSLLLLPDHDVRLAPVYDATATVLFPTQVGPEGERLISRRLALPIAAAKSVDDVRLEDLVTEAETWGLHAAQAMSEITGMLRSLPDQIANLASELPIDADLSRRLTTTVEARTTALLEGESAGRQDPTLAEYEAAAARLGVDPSHRL